MAQLCSRYPEVPVSHASARRPSGFARSRANARSGKTTLVVHGEQDATCSLDLTGRPTAALVPGVRLAIYAGAPHGLFLTHMAQLNADLLAFLKEA